MRLRAYSAVLTQAPSPLAALPGVRLVTAAEAEHQRSPAAAYGVDALETLRPRPVQPALYSIAGPAGSALNLFDAALRGSADGTLLGTGFSERRYRRIHPFTLLRSMPNQVAASISLHFDWRGPCCSVVASPTAFADLLPSIEAMVQRRACVVVMSSAGDRAEDRSWYRHLEGERRIVEGAIGLLFECQSSELGRRGKHLGTVFSGASDERRGAAMRESVPEVELPVAPGLESGLQILAALSVPAPFRTALPSRHRPVFFERRQ